jgi:hypothetical protein
MCVCVRVFIRMYVCIYVCVCLCKHSSYLFSNFPPRNPDLQKHASFSFDQVKPSLQCNFHHKTFHTYIHTYIKYIHSARVNRIFITKHFIHTYIKYIHSARVKRISSILELRRAVAQVWIQGLRFMWEKPKGYLTATCTWFKQIPAVQNSVIDAVIG